MTHSHRFVFSAAVFTAALLSASVASATPFNFIRIGDLDGFGYAPAGFVRSNGAPADTNGNGLLEVTEFLPDRNANGQTATGQGDDFDHRTASEIANSVFSGSGFTSLPGAIQGSNWTDVALSTSFLASGLSNFPDPAGPAVPNEPQFIFDFFVEGVDANVGANVFFNVLFGDYDVVPANITLTFASAPTRTLALVTQAGPADGLIQASFATLGFNEVFTAAGSGYNGFVRVNFNAANEPYTAFDFAELSTTPIATGIVPEPASIVLLATGGLGLLAHLRRRRK